MTALVQAPLVVAALGGNASYPPHIRGTAQEQFDIINGLTERLLEYPWPGNVRELQHLVERVVVLAHDVEADLDALPDSVRLAAPPDGPSFSGEVMPIRRLQSSYAQWALARMGGHKGRTAERLDVDQKTLARWLARDDDDR